jgi:DNA-binding NtrC family response regulator
MGERIIIAEDDEDLPFVLREALRRQRYDVDIAPTAGGMLDGLKATPAAAQRAAQARPAALAGPALSGSLDDALEEWERRMILDALQQTQGVQARAAKILGVSERGLWYRINKLGVQVRTPDHVPPA